MGLDPWLFNKPREWFVLVGFGWLWLVFDQIDQKPTKVNQKRPTSMYLTVAVTVAGFKKI